MKGGWVIQTKVDEGAIDSRGRKMKRNRKRERERDRWEDGEKGRLGMIERGVIKRESEINNEGNRTRNKERKR